MSTATPVFNPAAPTNGNSSVIGAYNTALAAASAALGVSDETLLFDFFPIYARGELTGTIIGTGSRSAQTQALRLSTGVGVGATASLFPNTVNGFAPKPIIAGAAKKWWIGAYFGVVSSAIAASELAGIGMHDLTTGDLGFIGLRGSSSTTNFVAWCDTGGTIDSGIALDNSSRHLHQFWRDGVTSNYKIDANATVQGNIRPSANVSAPSCKVLNASAVDRSVDYVWTAFAVIRE